MFAASKTDGAVVGGATDPYFPYVPLLLETTSTNGQQNNTFLDSSTNNFTITRNGTPTQGSVTPYWPNGYWSNNFNGSTDNISAPSTAMSYAGDFSIECWFNTTTTTTYACLYSDEGVGGIGGTILINNGANNGQIVVFIGSAVSTFTSSSTGLNNGTWNHVALTRSGSTLRLFINGALQNTTTASGTITTTSTVKIGYSFYASRFFGGYISNFRIVVGSAVYTASFTPSTTPLTPITNTTLLTCQSNRFIDTNTQVAAKTITVVSTPRAQAFQPFSPVASYTPALYGGSGYFNGSSQLQNTNTTAFDFSSSSTLFTIEAWIYPTVSAAQGIVCARTNAVANGWGVSIPGNVLTLAGVIIGSGYADRTLNSTAFPLNAWTHIAVVKDLTGYTGYVNGVAGTKIALTAGLDYASANPLTVGSVGSGGEWPYTGYISNLRIVKGAAVYTGAFTPPTLAPLTTAGSTSAASYSSTTNVNTSFASSATSLLTNFTNAGIYDAAVQNNALTVGDAQASTTQYKWSPTSMKFDGTGDWLTAIDGPQLNIGTGDFTIECWVNRTAAASGAGNGDTIISKGTNNIILSINVNTSKFEFAQYGVAVLLTSTTVISNGTWYYVAITRSGTTLRMFINGTQEASTTNSANFTSTTSMFVGADANNTNQRLNGYIQDLRITKGVARTITASPTAAFPTR
jgi:hypothetical protein